MKIALVGYGKMGHAIEQVALQRGHEIGVRIGSKNLEEMTGANISKADVAIEFTRPDAAPGNVITLLSAGTPVVCGTTGWNERLADAESACRNGDTAFIYASNFSLGVNIFFEINKILAKLMNGHPEYDVEIEETHHLQKKDAPSGTAISLAEQILERLERKDKWALKEGFASNTDLRITALREEGVSGTHKVSYRSAIDTIDIIHTAHSREGFALGAVVAAEFIAGKKGVFTMKDVLGI